MVNANESKTTDVIHCHWLNGSCISAAARSLNLGSVGVHVIIYIWFQPDLYSDGERSYFSFPVLSSLSPPGLPLLTIQTSAPYIMTYWVNLAQWKQKIGLKQGQQICHVAHLPVPKSHLSVSLPYWNGSEAVILLFCLHSLFCSSHFCDEHQSPSVW